MGLKLTKSAFGVTSGKFHGFMVHHRGIEANPKKIQTLLDMESSAKIKDVQHLNGCIIVLNHFVACVTDCCLPFFNALKKGNDFFGWMIANSPFNN